MLNTVIAFLCLNVLTFIKANPLWDPPLSPERGPPILPRISRDQGMWTAFYCEGPNFRGECVTQRFASDQCQIVRPKYRTKLLSFIASSSNCVLYENIDCTGSYVPIYSSVQDLRAFNKIKSYQCRVLPSLKFQNPSRVHRPGHIYAPKPLFWVAGKEKQSATSTTTTSTPESSLPASSVDVLVQGVPTPIAVPNADQDSD